MADFLLEIGTEELPARFLTPEISAVANLFDKALAEVFLKHGEITVSATPRRIAIIVKGLAPEQESSEDTIMGPAVKIAYDQQGQPTRALAGFARSQNVTLEEIIKVDTAKGEYAAVRKHVGGRPAKEILAELCPQIIRSIPFAKKMRWGDNDETYARPVRWILALYDDEVLPFSYGPIQSNRLTYGHRVHGAGPISVANVNQYPKLIAEQGSVFLEPSLRKTEIKNKANLLAAEKNGEIVWDEGLLEEVCGLIECPVPLLGEFSENYLEIPDEVLLTSMQTHQKSFGLRGKDGKLLPYFLTVLNLRPEDMEIVKKGWQRVLKARLEDARFFWQSDLGQNFSVWLDKLEHVIFIGPLGSMADKSRRLVKLCEWIVNECLPELDQKIATRAAQLAKADLVSGMVGEFDTLQGIMGGIYALKSGEREEVAKAIQEQYLPAGPDTPSPQSLYGAVLSMADKADTLAGCFGLNMIPSGMADPNGLRRCALGIIRILLDHDINLKIGDLFRKARKLYGDQNWKLSEDESQQKLLAFFEGRLRNYFLAKGYETVMVEAALASGFERAPDCKNRLDALVAFSQDKNFLKGVQTLKRIANITKKQTVKNVEWQDTLLVEQAEKNLATNLNSFLPKIDALLESGEYGHALAILETLRISVEEFFNDVMVLCEDQDLQNNRLALLNALHERYARIAKFSLLQI